MIAVANRFAAEMDQLRAVVQLANATLALAKEDPRTFRSRHKMAVAALGIHAAAHRATAAGTLPFEGAFLVACAQFELAIRDVIEAFTARAATKVAAYSALPPALREQHIDGSARVLQRLNRDQFRHLSADGVIGALAGCVAQPPGSTYSLVAEAFSANEHNFKHRVLADHMAGLGVREYWVQMGKEPVLQHALGTVTPGLTQRYATQKLDHLMDRRNQLIHRGKSFALVGESEVVEAAECFAALVKATANVLTAYVASL